MLRILVTLTFLSIFSVRALVLEELIEKGELEHTLSGKKIGYYIGSFDPLHLGHEDVAKKIVDQNLCDYVIVYPAWGGDKYKNRTDVNIRLEMLFAAFKDHPKVIVTKLNPAELQNVLMENEKEKLVDGNPSVKSKINGAEYIGVIGSDTAIETVKDKKRLAVFMKGIQIPEKYKENTSGGVIALPVNSFIVSLRKGDSIEILNGNMDDRKIIKTIETEYPEVSSTKIRSLLKAGQSIDDLVSKAVAKVITKYNLYVQ